jgi:hypothetical protein
MHRTHVCVVCAALASLIALLLMLAPTPATAQAELPTTVQIGDGDDARVVVVTLKMLGSDRGVPDFKLLVLAKRRDGSNHNSTGVTDKDGKLRIELREMPKELRVFAYGDYFIPEGWSNIPISNMKFEKTEPWSLQVRPLKRVKITGRVTVADTGAPAARASVAFAPLDVAQDGSFRMFDEPRGTLTDEDGRYEIELPTGYYQVWSYWADRSHDDWPGFIRVNEKAGLFEAQEIDLALEAAPTIHGRVIDGRTGEGVAASVNLYTNQYLRQLKNFTSDGKMPEEIGPNGEEIIWPVGTFRIQAWMINPDDFTVVIRPQGSDQVIRVISNLRRADFEGKELVWELYTDDMRVTDVKVTTHEHDMPVHDLDVNLLPVEVDVPEHLSQAYQAAGYTDDDGVVRFMGLATGSYEVYGGRGSMFLGKITVTEARQAATLEYRIPFVTGTVKVNGETCKNLVVFRWQKNQVGQEFGPYSQDAFLSNAKLREEGRLFVPLLKRGTTFRLVFAAMEDGKEFKDGDWARLQDFPLATEEIVITVDDEKAWEFDLELKANPVFVPKDQSEDD